MASVETTDIKDDEFGNKKKRRSTSILKNQPIPVLGIENQDPTTTITKKIRRVSWAEKRSVKLFEIENGSHHTTNGHDFDKCKEQTSSSVMSMCSNVQGLMTDKLGYLESHMTSETMSICRTDTPDVEETVDFLLNNVLPMTSQSTKKIHVDHEPFHEPDSQISNVNCHNLRSRSNKTTSIMEISEEKSVNVKKLWMSMQIEPEDDDDDDHEGGDGQVDDNDKDTDMEIVNDHLVYDDDHLISFRVEESVLRSPEKIVEIPKEKKIVEVPKNEKIVEFQPRNENFVEMPKEDKIETSKKEKVAEVPKEEKVSEIQNEEKVTKLTKKKQKAAAASKNIKAVEVSKNDQTVDVLNNAEKLTNFKKFGPLVESIWMDCRQKSELDWTKLSSQSVSVIDETVKKEFHEFKQNFSKLILSVSSSALDDERDELKTKINDIAPDVEVLENLSQNEINQFFNYKQKLEKFNDQQRKTIKEKAKFEHELIRKNIETMSVKQKIAEKRARELQESLARRDFYALNENDSSAKTFQETLQEFLPWKLLKSSSYSHRRTFRCWRFLLTVDGLENSESAVKIELDPVDYCTEKERYSLFRPFCDELMKKKLSNICSKSFSTEDELISAMHETAKIILHSEAVYGRLLEIFRMFNDVKYLDSKLTICFYSKRSSVKTEIVVQLNIFTYPNSEITILEVKNGCFETISQRLQEAKENSHPSKIMSEFLRTFVVRKH